MLSAPHAVGMDLPPLPLAHPSSLIDEFESGHDRILIPDSPAGARLLEVGSVAAAAARAHGADVLVPERDGADRWREPGGLDRLGGPAEDRWRDRVPILLAVHDAPASCTDGIPHLFTAMREYLDDAWLTVSLDSTLPDATLHLLRRLVLLAMDGITVAEADTFRAVDVLLHGDVLRGGRVTLDGRATLGGWTEACIGPAEWDHMPVVAAQKHAGAAFITSDWMRAYTGSTVPQRTSALFRHPLLPVFEAREMLRLALSPFHAAREELAERCLGRDWVEPVVHRTSTRVATEEAVR